MTTWHEIARESQKAANELVRTRFRPCVSRAYYAAYAKVTHDLVQAGVPMPRDREGPAHPGHLPGGTAGTKGIRVLIVKHLVDFEVPKRRELSELIGELYVLRLNADYHPSLRVEDREAREAVAIMNTIFAAF